MGHSIQLNTSRMHCIGAWLAQPSGAPLGGIVVAQEIFGVNPHIRSVVDRYAEAGYTAIAPAFFDHVESGVEFGYDAESFKRGRALAGEVGLEQALADVASAAESITREPDSCAGLRSAATTSAGSRVRSASALSPAEAMESRRPPAATGASASHSTSASSHTLA